MPRGVKTARSVNRAPKRELITKDRDGSQAYGVVTKLLGNGRMSVKLEDGTECTCKVRGSMRRREWVNLNDWVLVAYREFGGSHGDSHDIVRKYAADEVQQLRYFGELDEAAQAEEPEDPADHYVTFEDI